jgi:hypothetical protein
MSRSKLPDKLRHYALDAMEARPPRGFLLSAVDRIEFLEKELAEAIAGAEKIEAARAHTHERMVGASEQLHEMRIRAEAAEADLFIARKKIEGQVAECVRLRGFVKEAEAAGIIPSPDYRARLTEARDEGFKEGQKNMLETGYELPS